MPHLFTASRVGGKVTIVATNAGDQTDTPQPTVVRGTDSTADTTPDLLKVQDGEGGLDWSTPVEDGIDGIDGVRGAGQFPGNVTLGAGASAPLVTSSGFRDDALAIIVARLGAGSTPVKGDVAIITYTKDDGTVQTRSGIYDGTNWGDFDYQIDGNLLVTGTVVADTINADTVIANDVQSTGFLAGSAGYQLDGSTGNAEFSNVTIRGNSTVESTSISGTGIWGVAERGLSIMTAQSFADGQHTILPGSGNQILDQIDTPVNYSFNDYTAGDWVIETVGSDIRISLGTSTSSGAGVPTGAQLTNGVTGGFIVRWFQNDETSFFEGWTGTSATGFTTTISNNTKLSGVDLVAGDSQPATVTFFNGITTPTTGDTFTSYIVRQDGQFSLDPDMLIQFTRVPTTDGTDGGTMTITDLVLTLQFEPIPDAADAGNPMGEPIAIPEVSTTNLTITETGAGVRTLSIIDDSIVKFGTDQRIEFQPAAFSNGVMPTLEIGTIVTLRVRFTVSSDSSSFRGLKTFLNVRDISLAGGAPSLFSTLALDTTDSVASIGSDDNNKFPLTVAGGRGLRVVYDRVFSGVSKVVNGIDLGKSGFIMVRWDNIDSTGLSTANENNPNTGIYPFQNAFFTSAGDQLIKSTSNGNEEYFFGDKGDSATEKSAIKLVDVTDNDGLRIGSLWTKVSLSGLETELILTPGKITVNSVEQDINTDIIGVFITSWNFGTIRDVNEI